MWNFLKTRGVDLTIATIGLTVLMVGPVLGGCSSVGMPGPPAAVLVGAVIIGAIVIAKLWRRR